jgi:hypothetical protein
MCLPDGAAWHVEHSCYSRRGSCLRTRATAGADLENGWPALRTDLSLTLTIKGGPITCFEERTDVLPTVMTLVVLVIDCDYERAKRRATLMDPTVPGNPPGA